MSLSGYDDDNDLLFYTLLSPAPRLRLIYVSVSLRLPAAALKPQNTHLNVFFSNKKKEKEKKKKELYSQKPLHLYPLEAWNNYPAQFHTPSVQNCLMFFHLFPAEWGTVYPKLF